MKKIYITFSGCVESRVEASLYEKYFIHNGYIKTKTVEDADIILYFTCGFMKLREDESLEKISMLQKKKKKGARIVIGGCLTRINSNCIRDIFDDIMIHPYETAPLKEVFHLRGNLSDVTPVYFQPRYIHKAQSEDFPWAIIRIIVICIIIIIGQTTFA